MTRLTLSYHDIIDYAFQLRKLGHDVSDDKIIGIVLQLQDHVDF